MTAKRFILTEDKYSNFPPKQGTDKRLLYACKGTELTEICRNGDMLIVEAKNGQRFAVNMKILIEKPTQ